MRLRGVKLKNFRAWTDDQLISLDSLTAFVGRNDVGKSTVFDALGVFFGHSQCKIDAGDRCVHAPSDAEVAITCVFDELPPTLVLDQSAETTLAEELLLNSAGHLEIKKTYSGVRMKEDVFAVALHPKDQPLSNLLQLKNTDLKRLAKELTVEADQRSNVALRRAIRAASDLTELTETEIPLAKEGAKEIWTALRSQLPLFALFRSDRPSTDEDAEVQDPMKIAVREALGEVKSQLDAVSRKVEERALGVARRTLEKLAEMDEHLASTLAPRFRAEPKWDSIFKLSLVGDDEIPINKRGSGVRRLVLLSFFQADVERQRGDGCSRVIYAIEEPETSQHPSNQRVVVEALKRLANAADRQVLVTTHVPGLVGLLPAEGIRHITQDTGLRRNIESGEDILKDIADDLGVMPDLLSSKVKVILCVEGPNDVEFFQRLSRILRETDPTLPDLEADQRVAVIPLGGSTLKAWVNKKYLRDLRLPEIHIYDRDKEAEYQAAVDEVNQRGDGSWAALTKKREMENYLHPDAIQEVLGVTVAVDDKCDVEERVRVALGQGKVGRRQVKDWLNVETVERMTAERLKERSGWDEMRSWFDKIQALLKS